jgi:flagellar biosynthesis protein
MSKRDQDKRPPDLAVALRYDGRGAPRVTAKGEDEVARRICEVAEEHGVPLYEDARLAPVLASIDLGEEIPENLYRAVAEVIAFAYLLEGRISPLPTPRQEPPESSELMPRDAD